MQVGVQSSVHNFVFIFENIIQLSETRQLFLYFLEQEQSQNLLLFYESAFQFYQHVKNHIWLFHLLHNNSKEYSFDIYHHVDLLLRNYLLATSHFPISLFDYCRRKTITKIQHRYEQRTTIFEDSKYFITHLKEFVNCVLQRLKQELFPQFLQSPLWLQFTLNKATQLHSLEKLCTKVGMKRTSPLFFRKFLYTGKEWTEECIREKDFQFVYQLSHDNSHSIWKIVAHRIQISKFNFCSTSNKDSMRWIKYCDYIPFSIETVLGILLQGDYLRQLSWLQPFDVQPLHSIIPSVSFPFWNEDTQLQLPVASSIIKLSAKQSIFKKTDALANVSIKSIPHLDQYLFVIKSFSKTYKLFHGLVIQKISPCETKLLVTVQIPYLSLISHFFKTVLIHKTNQFINTVIRLCETFQSTHLEWCKSGNSKQLMEEIQSEYVNSLQWNNFHLQETTKWYETILSNSNLFDMNCMNKIKVRI